MADNRDATQVAGTTPYFNSALSSTKQAVKASAARLYGYHIQNPNISVDAYVQFFDLASASVTVGTTVPTFTLWVPAGGGVDVYTGTAPINFLTAITIAATTTSTGSTAPATGLLTNLFYV